MYSVFCFWFTSAVIYAHFSLSFIKIDRHLSGVRCRGGKKKRIWFDILSARPHRILTDVRSRTDSEHSEQTFLGFGFSWESIRRAKNIIFKWNYSVWTLFERLKRIYVHKDKYIKIFLHITSSTGSSQIRCNQFWSHPHHFKCQILLISCSRVVYPKTWRSHILS